MCMEIICLFYLIAFWFFPSNNTFTTKGSSNIILAPLTLKRGTPRSQNDWLLGRAFCPGLVPSLEVNGIKWCRKWKRSSVFGKAHGRLSFGNWMFRVRMNLVGTNHRMGSSSSMQNYYQPPGPLWRWLFETAPSVAFCYKMVREYVAPWFLWFRCFCSKARYRVAELSRASLPTSVQQVGYK